MSDRDTFEAFSHGAAGFLLKRYPPQRRAMNCPSLLFDRWRQAPARRKKRVSTRRDLGFSSSADEANTYRPDQVLNGPAT